MTIGVLKEGQGENRVVLLPGHVSSLIKKKHRILVENGAGASAFADDLAYEEAGAEIKARDAVIKEADLILAIHPPSEKIGKDKVLIGVLGPLNDRSPIEKLAQEGVVAYSLDMIPRSTRAQSVDVLSSQATVAGYKAVLTAAASLSGFFPMFMSASGTIKPSKVLILGAGVAGLQALATARKLGAVVEVFDVRTAVKEEVQSLGGKFVEVEGAKDDAAAGGYAVEQTEEYKKKQAELIQEHAKQADVVITTAQIPGRKAPILIQKSTVEAMRPGSVIVDLAASTGGNCEFTKDGEMVEHQGVKIIGDSNLASTVASDASKMLGNNYLNFIDLMFDDEGKFSLDVDDEIVQQTCMCRNGEIINERIK